MKKFLLLVPGLIFLSFLPLRGVNAHVSGTIRMLQLGEGMKMEEREKREWVEIDQIPADFDIEEVFQALRQIEGGEKVLRMFEEEAELFPPEEKEGPPERWRTGPRPVLPGSRPSRRRKIALLTPNNPINPGPWKAYLDLWDVDLFAGYSDLWKQCSKNRVAYLNPGWDWEMSGRAGRINGWFHILERGWYLFAAKVWGGNYGIEFDVYVDNQYYGNFEVKGVDLICVCVWLSGRDWHKIQFDHTEGWGWFISLKAWGRAGRRY